MFPSERQAITNTIAKVVFHNDADGQSLNFGNLLNEDIVEKAFNNSWDRVRGFFSTVGQWSSAVFGIFIIVKFVKFIIDTVAHGIMLHGY